MANAISAIPGAITYPVASDNSAGLAAPTVAAGSNGLALGHGATTTAQNSVALGNGSTDGGRANVVSVGSASATRQIINVGNGTQAADAVNLSQLRPLVQALGGGSQIDSTTGAVTGPSYTVGGQTYADVASAITATNRLGVQYTANAAGTPTDQIVLSGANDGRPVTITNVAPGTQATDAVNYGQFKQGLDATNARVANVEQGLNALSGNLDTVRREERGGIAGTAAMANLPFGSTPGRFSTAAAVGGYKGTFAFAGGVQYSSPDNSLKVKGSAGFVPGQNTPTWGAGVGWEF